MSAIATLEKPRYYRFIKAHPLMPHVSIPKGTVWYGNLNRSIDGKLTLNRVPNEKDGTGSVREGFGSSNEASVASNLLDTVEEVSEKEFLAYVNRGESFFDKYKTYILVGASIVVVVIGYFVYDKYFK